MSTLTTVIFDLDGTLIDSEGDLRTAANLMLSDFGCAPLSEGEFRGMIGDGTAALVARALAARQCTDAGEPAALYRFLEHYESNVTTLTLPYPGVPNVLEALRARGLKLGLCTNKPLKLTRLILKRLALDDCFAQVVAGDSLPYRKPDSRVLLATLSRLHCPSGSAIMVGDSEVDASMAAGAGVPFVLMTYGYHRVPMTEIPCVAALDRFESLADFLGPGGR